MKKKESSVKWLKFVVVVLLLGYAFIAGVAFDQNAVATTPEPEPEKAFYTRWYESLFPPEVIVEPDPKPFYTRWYHSAFPPEVIVEVEPEPEPAFYVRWYRMVFPLEVEEVPIPEIVESEVIPSPLEPALS